MKAVKSTKNKSTLMHLASSALRVRVRFCTRTPLASRDHRKKPLKAAVSHANLSPALARAAINSHTHSVSSPQRSAMLIGIPQNVSDHAVAPLRNSLRTVCSGSAHCQPHPPIKDRMIEVPDVVNLFQIALIDRRIY